MTDADRGQHDHPHCSCGACIPNVFVITLGTMYELQTAFRQVRPDEVMREHAAIFSCPRCGRWHCCVHDVQHSQALNEIRENQGKASREA